MYKDYKQVMVIRTDLGMGKGKMCGQVAHASISAYIFCPPTVGEAWLIDGQTKIVCKVGSEDELQDVAAKAQVAGIEVSRIHDAGRTQLEPGTLTCIGIGPYLAKFIDPITKDLKLL